MRIKAVFTAVTALLLLDPVYSSAALRQRSAVQPNAPLQTFGQAKPIEVAADFCGRHPEECIGKEEPIITLVLTRQMFATIRYINRRVNNSIKPQEDQNHHNTPDRWDLAEDGFGDCEDYALLKRHKLASEGMLRNALRLTVVLDEDNQGHMVLSVFTDQGVLILDNKRNEVLHWFDTGYTFQKMEGPSPTGWVSLGSVKRPQDYLNIVATQQ